MDNGLSISIAFYFFLAGAGSGAYLMAVVLGKRLERSFRNLLRTPPLSFAEASTVLSIALVTAGSLFLLFDLGWPALFPLVIRMPHVSIISFGAYSITLFLLFAAARIAAPRLLPARIGKPLGTVCKWAAWVCALATATYTGAFLFSMKAIPFWNSPWIVVLFFVSALSTGTACLLALVACTRAFCGRGALVSLCRADSLLIVLEAAVLALFVASRLNGSATAHASALAFLFGPESPWFWIALVGVGLAVPLVAEQLFAKRQNLVCAHIATAGTLAGGLALRCCIILI